MDNDSTQPIIKADNAAQPKISGDSIITDDAVKNDDTGNEPKVIIYSTTWCAFCKTEEQYLNKLGVAYVKKDVEEDKAAYEELMAKIGGNFQGVPVTDIAGEIVLGFNRPKIDETLKTKSLITA